MITAHLTKNDVYEKRAELQYNVDIVTKLLNNDLITKKYLGNQVTSFGFKKQVFFDNTFDSLLIKARGLFIYDDGQICARSFDKFFNVFLDNKWRKCDEFEYSDCPIEALKDKLKFPLKVFVKENGYLGILSYSKITDDYFIASKSTTEGEYAQWFRNQISYFFNDQLKEFLKTENISLIFEVIDMEHDGGHMIDYGYNSKILYLIGAVENNFEGKFYDWEQLLAISDKYFSSANKDHKLMVKKYYQDLETFEELERLLKEYEKDEEYNNKEGFVIHDVSGFMFKYKTKYYRNWKEARKALELILQNKPVKPTSYQLSEFVIWAQNNRNLLLQNNCDTIIKARNLYNETIGEN